MKAYLCHVSDSIYGVLGSAGLQVPAAPVQVHLDGCVFTGEAFGDHHGGRQVDLNWWKHRDIEKLRQINTIEAPNKLLTHYLFVSSRQQYTFRCIPIWHDNQMAGFLNLLDFYLPSSTKLGARMQKGWGKNPEHFSADQDQGIDPGFFFYIYIYILSLT